LADCAARASAALRHTHTHTHTHNTAHVRQPKEV
jgi:hypothetical protein